MPVTDIGGFWVGFATPLNGLRYMMARRGLWRYAIVPILLNILITLLVLMLLAGAVIWFVVKLHPRFPATWWGVGLEILSAIVWGLMAIAITVVISMLLNSILCEYFYGLLARQVDIQLGMPADQMREIPFLYQVIDGIRDAVHLLVVNVGVLALSFVPVIGTVVAVPLALYLNGFTFGMDYLDYPLEHRGMRWADKIAFAKRHRWETIGLGVAVFGMNLVPIIGSVFLATAAAGAVLLYRRLDGEGTPRS